MALLIEFTARRKRLRREPRRYAGKAVRHAECLESIFRTEREATRDEQPIALMRTQDWDDRQGGSAAPVSPKVIFVGSSGMGAIKAQVWEQAIIGD